MLGVRTVALDGEVVSYTLKRSSRARCVRLEVREGSGLIVVIPRSYRAGDLGQLLKEKRRWILRHLASCARPSPLGPGGHVGNSDAVSYLGRDLRLIEYPADRSTPGVSLEQNQLVIRGPSDKRKRDLVLERWYRSQALQVTASIADDLVTRLGLRYRRITIRGQRTRWGSCSHSGSLSFNWRLMMAPEAVVNYVVVHEVAHLREMNHTSRFWGLVSEECPRWREHRQWLDEHGSWLTARPFPP